MKKYVKPTVEIVEMEVKERIASLVPRTVYKRNNSSSAFTAPADVDLFKTEEGQTNS